MSQSPLGTRSETSAAQSASEVSTGAGPLITSAYLNSFKSVVPHAAKTGLRTAQLRFNAFPEGQTDIAAEFLLNSRYRRGDREFELSVRSYFEDAALAMVSRVDERCTQSATQPISVPMPLRLPMALHEAIAQRRSRRDLSGDPLGFDQLTTLLQCGAGVTAYATTELSSGKPCRMPLRSSPSGGGLYPIDIHFGARAVQGLDPGLYRFVGKQNAVLREGSKGKDWFEALCQALPGPVNAQAAAAVLALVIRPWRSKRKYGARGLRFALMECGYISQNIHLAATALGIRSCDHGGFHDDEINALLDLDGLHSTVIHVILVGG